MKRIIDIIREAIPQVIGTLIATAILATASIVSKSDNNVIWLATSMAILIWIACIYLTYARDEPKILHTLPVGHRYPKGPYKYPVIRSWTLRGTYFIPFLAFVGLGYYLIINVLLPPPKVIILVADFDGPEVQRYRVTETIFEKLSSALENQEDILISRTNESYYDSTTARKAGKDKRAAMVIWDWYGITNDASSLSVNFDIMDQFLKDYSFCSSAKGEPRIGTRADFERYTIQTDLSNELSYLILFTTGLANYVSGNHEDAINNLDKALEVAPNDPSSWPKRNVYHLRGEIYYDQGKYDLAVNDYNKAIETYSEDSELYFDRAEVLLKLENYEAVVSDWDKYLTFEPEDVYVLFNRGSLNFYLGNFEEAAIDFRKGLDLEPGTPCALVESGYSHYLIGDYEHALMDFNSAVDVGFSAEGHFGRGIVFFRQNNYEQAIAELTESIESASDKPFPAAHEYRGYAYIAFGDKEKAKGDLLRFLEIMSDPDKDYVWFYRGYEEQAVENVKKELLKLGVDLNSP